MKDIVAVARLVLLAQQVVRGPWDSVRLRTASTHWNVPVKYGPLGELFFFLLKKEPMVLGELISANTVK